MCRARAEPFAFDGARHERRERRVRLDQGDAFMPLDARENEIELPA